MSKGYLLGDIYLGVNQLDLDKWLDIHKMYFYDFLIPIINKHYLIGDKIFILGSLFDNKTQIHHKTISFTLDLFNYFEKMEYDIVILGDYEQSFLRILEKYKNVNIYNTSSVYIINNKKILLLPLDKQESQLKEIKKWSGKVDYFFIFDSKGAKNSINSYLGRCFDMDISDSGTKKGLTIIEFKDGTEEFIENNITPKYVTIEINKESDLDILDNSLYKKNDFIDVVVNTSLKSLKNARIKIEEIAKTTNISSIKYIDDIPLEDINFDESDFDVSTEHLIKKYIIAQNVEKHIKEKYLTILNDVMKICKND